MSSKKTVFLKKYVDIYTEHLADGVITPGDLVEITATGVKRHATADGVASPIFAREDFLQGKTISDNYAALDRITVGHCVTGEVVQANLANGEDVAKGDLLTSNGAGKLQKYDSSGEYVVAIANEAVDMSGSSGEDPAGTISVTIF